MVVPTNASSTKTAEALVVGAGPSGLIGALSLACNRIKVRIIEKSPTHRIGQRGAGITPRSQELFKSLGVIDRIWKEAIPTPMLKMHDLHGGLHSGKIFEITPYTQPTSSTPYPNIMCLGQNNLERILRAELEEVYGITVELGTELLSLTQHADVVSTKISKNGMIEHVDYPWVVGADGAKGIVRKQLGVSFLGETSNVDNICVGDVIIEGLDNQFWHMWGDAATTLISLRPTESPPLFNFIISGQDVDREGFISTEGLLQRFLAEKLSAPELKFGSLPWISTYRPNIRMVDNMGTGRVYLVGDSAHVHSFTGAQGMNTGIQDSFSLGWRIAHVHHGLASPSLLGSYNEERLPVISEMLSQTTTLLNKNLRGQGKPSGWRREGNLLQLGINCRWSSIVVDESRTDGYLREINKVNPIDSYGRADGDMTLRAGDRALDTSGLRLLHAKFSMYTSPQGEEHRLTDILDGIHHTVVLFSSDVERCTTVLNALASYPSDVVRSAVIVRDGEALPPGNQDPDFVFEDAEEYAYATYDLENDCDMVVIRPDGILGGILKSDKGLRQYFGTVFSSSV
ncbi:pentachlorophenol 4-monooxygenase [Moniliophthora roreri MCA 2997]|uniref:Pentachlorophenol 4-monooxygenase n=2 Tax=Moniliophthora roreri TaxID=221103 RepID=V2X6W9_MONRO|nr:pentachlorophenol 4-monooxygenase [Moniliophthora roreri MCA 2997]